MLSKNILPQGLVLVSRQLRPVAVDAGSQGSGHFFVLGDLPDGRDVRSYGENDAAGLGQPLEVLSFDTQEQSVQIDRILFFGLQIVVGMDVEQLGAVVDGVVEAHDGRVDAHFLEESVHRECQFLFVHGHFTGVDLPETVSDALLDLPTG